MRSILCVVLTVLSIIAARDYIQCAIVRAMPQTAEERARDIDYNVNHTDIDKE